MALRYPVLLAMTFLQCCILSSGFIEGEFIVTMVSNAALKGYIFRNISTGAVNDCLKHCLADCLCQSFQICHGVCQLSSSSRHLMASSMRDISGCSYYDFEATDPHRDHREPMLSLYENTDKGEHMNSHCASCHTGINCCLTSTPCLNGGACTPAQFMGRKNRFSCQCPSGWAGERCERKPCAAGYQGSKCNVPIKSCHGYNDGERAPGVHTLLDDSFYRYQAFCDFDGNGTSSWTLVQSYSLQNRIYNAALLTDHPQNEASPSNWNDYRLSREKMMAIRQNSKLWRITCNYRPDVVLDTDTMRGSFHEVDILNFDGGAGLGNCVRLNYLSIRGQACRNCSAFLAQIPGVYDGYQVPLHLDAKKSIACGLSLTGSPVCGGRSDEFIKGVDYFGFYHCKNQKHHCASSDAATTQIWFGSRK